MFLLRRLDPKAVTLIDIDFKRPWWSLIAAQKGLFCFIIISMIIVHGFWFITPFLIKNLFDSPTVFNVIIIFLTWLAVDCLHLYARTVNARFQLQCIHSIYKSAHSFLLTVDPMYHIHRSSGALLAKIDRGARGYEELLDQITFELVPLFVGLTVMITSLVSLSAWLALFEGILFAVILFFSYLFARYGSHQWEQSFIKSDDAFKSVAVENLAQVHMVRSLFASDYMCDVLEKKILDNAESERGFWLSYAAIAFLLNSIYFLSIASLVIFLAYQLNQGLITAASALGLAIACTQSTRAIVSVTSRFRRYIRGWTGAQDLFSSMANFGKQGFPVLGKPCSIGAISNELSVVVDDISFNYETAKLFNGHNFKITYTKNMRPTLIGIIGASGTGKSTFLSILGGQLKPKIGTVKINGIDIYAINDANRRQLIALQGQVATSVKGTVKYNMLFGLPANHGFDDRKLLDVLNRVGLLVILQNHNGLDTMLGEGGLSLSGGQRQRLNFAALYLRSIFYKPAIILIDEPTSSLDEVSEAAITTMIMELAAFAITFVIAHRLKTIEQAIGIIDLSLLQDEHDIKLYTPEELYRRSAYYQQLCQGKISLNN